MSATPERGNVLAFDFGERRVGVAVGELGVRVAHPLTTLHVRSDADRIGQTQALVREWEPVLFVVGRPAHSDGRLHELAGRCERFARRLSATFRVPALMVDETLSSHAAGQSLTQAGVSGRRQARLLDQVAAQHILQSYFDGAHATA
ncbi:MAG: Holliday junction resolvase RuvX [Burkholderiales bacterium]|nr:Holliday junction resolvase RuvX [Burkholderiales bacterium]